MGFRGAVALLKSKAYQSGVLGFPWDSDMGFRGAVALLKSTAYQSGVLGLSYQSGVLGLGLARIGS
jgi:hypothetical protein